MRTKMIKDTERKERGVSLIIAMLALLVLSVLIAGIVLVTQTEVWTTANYRELAQARYAAEAGVQSTINWLQYTYVPPSSFGSYTMTTSPVTYSGSPVVLSAISSTSSNYPDAAQQSAFSSALSSQSLTGLSNASFSTSATLIAMTPSSGVSWLSGSTGGVMQTWQITSQGYVHGVNSATVQVVATYTRTGSPIFSYPIEALGANCGSIKFTGATLTDSYNSNNGVYSGTNSNSSGGNIATNGNVSLGSGANVEGIVYAPNTTVGGCPDGITKSGGTYSSATALSGTLTASLPWGCASQPCYPTSPAPITTSQNISTGCTGVAGCTKNGTTTIDDGGSNKTVNVFTLSPGSYGNITINGADVVHVSAGTYTVNSINFAQDGQFVVDSGPVILQLAGNCSSGCPTEGGLPAGYSSTEVIYGAGYAGFNGCSGGVTANPNVYGSTTCGSGKTAFSGIPDNLQIVYGGTYTIRLGGMPNAAVIYAPAAGYYTPGAPVGLYGSAVIKDFEDASGSPFHYDLALQNQVMQVGPFQQIGYTWSKF